MNRIDRAKRIKAEAPSDQRVIIATCDRFSTIKQESEHDYCSYPYFPCRAGLDLLTMRSCRSEAIRPAMLDCAAGRPHFKVGHRPRVEEPISLRRRGHPFGMPVSQLQAGTSSFARLQNCQAPCRTGDTQHPSSCRTDRFAQHGETGRCCRLAKGAVARNGKRLTR